MKKQWKKLVATLFIIIIFSISQNVCIFASDSGGIPDLSKDIPCSLRVSFSYTSEDSSVIVIAGAKMAICKVADFTVEQGVISYVLDKEFAESKVIFEKMTSSQSSTAAGELASIIHEKKIKIKEKTTNEEGKAFWGDLEAGMYLVMQTGSIGVSANYSEMQPFLLMLPMLEKVDEENIWNYSVLAKPKTEVTKIQKVPQSVPTITPKSINYIKTGDSSNTNVWIGCMFIGLILMTIAIILNKKRQN